jgi:hypothetical protein
MGEIRVTLTWRGKPSDLDLQCLLVPSSINGGRVSYSYRNTGNRYNPIAGNIEFESAGDHFFGFGPESIVCTPASDMKYTFVACRCADNGTLYNSGAMVTIFADDGTCRVIRININDLDYDEDVMTLDIWHMFEIHDGKVCLLNKLFRRIDHK